jgi:hypothetical protein
VSLALAGQPQKEARWMALPAFNPRGDLPEGVHQAGLGEVVARFGAGTEQRQSLSVALERVHTIAQRTGQLARFVIFGSFVTTKEEPNDVDVVLVMHDDFDVAACEGETAVVFDHRRVVDEMGVNVFWTRPAMLFRDTLDEFIRHWQIKRDGTRRGIVEVTS